MLDYSSLVTLYLLYLALSGKWNGPLLWLAVVLHAVLTLLLARTWFKPHENGQPRNPVGILSPSVSRFARDTHATTVVAAAVSACGFYRA